MASFVVLSRPHYHTDYYLAPRRREYAYSSRSTTYTYRQDGANTPTSYRQDGALHPLLRRAERLLGA